MKSAAALQILFLLASLGAASPVARPGLPAIALRDHVTELASRQLAGRSGANFTNGSTSGPASKLSANGPLIFAHWMLVTRPASGSYTADLQAAKDMGVDAFAINYGGDGTDFAQQDSWLDEFYNAAQQVGVKAFLSIDTSITPPMTPDKIVSLVDKLSSHSAQQLDASGAPLLTSFEHAPPTSWSWQTDVIDKVKGKKPNFVGCSMSTAASNTLTIEKSQGASGSVTWLLPSLTGDQMADLDKQTGDNKGGNTWIATIAPWFFKRLRQDQNWAQAADDAIFVNRWQTFLAMEPAKRPDAIEIATWNDWGEGSYIGPADSAGSCPQCYYDKLDHSGFQRIAKPFIRAYKSGASEPVIDDEEVFIFYRTQKREGRDDSPYGPPQDSANLKDDVYVVGMLKEAATATLVSGPVSTTIGLGPGVTKVGVPFGLGEQSVQLGRNGQPVGQKKTGEVQITAGGQVNDNIVIV